MSNIKNLKQIIVLGILAILIAIPAYAMQPRIDVSHVSVPEYVTAGDDIPVRMAVRQPEGSGASLRHVKLQAFLMDAGEFGMSLNDIPTLSTQPRSRSAVVHAPASLPPGDYLVRIVVRSDEDVDHDTPARRRVIHRWITVENPADDFEY